MTDKRPPAIRALDDTASEFDRLMKQVLAQADELSVERAELEKLHQVASIARLACTSFVLEAGTALIMEKRLRERKAALQ